MNVPRMPPPCAQGARHARPVRAPRRRCETTRAPALAHSDPGAAPTIQSAERTPTMLTTCDVASLTPAQRAELVRALMDDGNPFAVSRRWWHRRSVVAAGMIVAAAVLTVWICYLIPTL